MQDILDLLETSSSPRTSSTVFLEEIGALTIPSSSSITRLRHSHHLLARALAEGRTAVQAAAISGYDPSTVYRLQADPAFQELLAHYKSQVDDIFAAVQDRIGALGLSFLDELQHRLESNPQEFKVGQLLAAAQALLDRSVAPSKGQKAGNGAGGPAAVAVTISFGDTMPAKTLDLVSIPIGETG